MFTQQTETAHFGDLRQPSFFFIFFFFFSTATTAP